MTFHKCQVTNVGCRHAGEHISFFIQDYRYKSTMVLPMYLEESRVNESVDVLCGRGESMVGTTLQ